MPNRVIRDSILSNRQVEKLDWFQQVLLVRLILSCDDYGRYFAAPDIIRSYLFGINPGVTLDQVAEGMERLEELGFLFTYGVEGEIYCTFPQWSKYQVCRTRREKFPAPPSEAPGQELKKFAHKFHDAKQDSIGTAPETKPAPNPIQSESEIESEIKSESEAESEGPAGQAAAAESGRVEFAPLLPMLPTHRVLPPGRTGGRQYEFAGGGKRAGVVPAGRPSGPPLRQDRHVPRSVGCGHWTRRWQAGPIRRKWAKGESGSCRGEELENGMRWA